MENKTKCYCGHTIYCDCPSLEEDKEATLEDYVLDSDEHNNLTSDDNTYLNFHRQSELLFKGAKLGSEWQKEQDKKLYSEQEVLEIIDLLFHRYASSFRIDAKEYFLQFKKK